MREPSAAPVRTHAEQTADAAEIKSEREQIRATGGGFALFVANSSSP